MRGVSFNQRQDPGGQLEAAVGTAAEAAKLLGAHGGEIRFFLTLAGGEDVNGTLFHRSTRAPRPWPRRSTRWPTTSSSRHCSPG